MAIEADNNFKKKGGENIEPPPPTNHELSVENLSLYMLGCEEIAARLDSTIDKIIKKGQRPIILIPSRGAVPIFLQAKRILNELDPENSYLSDKNVNYYPNGVFEYLEGKEPKNQSPSAKVDVVLYPFTADVSSEGAIEWLAKRLRESCARSVLELIGQNPATKDFAWYKFIMRKLNEDTEDAASVRPKNVIESLSELPLPAHPQLILIDTVISGRAANDITSAFETLGHSVVPLLAVDNVNQGKFQQRRKSEIEASVPYDVIDTKGPFVEFPLISEDKGSALLGVCAINFANFNERGTFSKVSRDFSDQFIPQSCVWTLVPLYLRKMYIDTFRKFLEISWKIYQGEEVNQEEFRELQVVAHELTSTHTNPDQKEISAFVSSAGKPSAKETASHILSIKLPDDIAQDWIKEFVNKLNHSAP